MGKSQAINFGLLHILIAVIHLVAIRNPSMYTCSMSK